MDHDVALPDVPEVDHERVTLGTDPEMFVETSEGVLPAFQFLPPKKAALTVGDIEQSKMFWDGFQAEWAFTAPGYHCLAWMVDGTQAALGELRTRAQAVNPTAKLSPRSVVQVPDAFLQKAPFQHVELGCKPSLNLYGMSGEHVHDPRALPWRMAGGHIHLGCLIAVDEVVRCLDAILGVWAVGVAASLDNPVRRRYYGLAGEHRRPPHGLEYRTLSNFWLCHPAVMHLTFDLARVLVGFGQAGYRHMWQASDREVVETINATDVKSARIILERNRALFEHLVTGIYKDNPDDPGDGHEGEDAYFLGMGGIEGAFKEPTDIAGNWLLDGGWQEHSCAEGCMWTKRPQRQ